MRGPSSPRSWLRWAAYVLEAQGRPFSPRYDDIPGVDHRMRDSRETALSVKRILEKVTNCNGAGKLLVEYYVRDASWWSFTEEEQQIIEKTARTLAKALREAGFIEGKE